MINPLRLRPFEDSDIRRFKEWVFKPYVVKWYSDPQSWIYEIEHRHDEFHWLNHFIAVIGGKDIGFCQYYEYKMSGETWHGDVELDGTYSIDYLIGEEEYLARGLGRRLIRLLTQRVLTLPDAKRIIVQPEAENTRSREALLSAGYLFDPQNDLYFMMRDAAACNLD